MSKKVRGAEFELLIKPKRIFFPKDSSYSMDEPGFAIFVAEVTDALSSGFKSKDIKLKGNSTSLDQNERYKVRVVLSETSEKYGSTYEIVFMRNNRSVSTPEDVKKLLMAVLGDSKGLSIFTELEDPIAMLESKDVEGLSKVKGIGAKSALKLIKKYDECKDFGKLYGELVPHGITHNSIKKLIDVFGNEESILKLVRETPYELSKFVKGFGFKKCDEIAKKMGLDPNSPMRVNACILFLLEQFAEEGKEYPSYSEVVSKVYETIGFISNEVLCECCKELVNTDSVVLINGGENICSKKYHKIAKLTSEHLERLGTNDNFYIRDTLRKFDYKSILDNFEECYFPLADRQREALESLVGDSKIVITTGNAGSGKTSVSRLMLDIIEGAGLTVALTTFTGKASKRLAEATGRQASTIHRLLGVDQEGRFTHNSENNLGVDVVLLDEAGMVSADLFYSLVQAIPTGAMLIILGDTRQLTAIGSGNILGDLLDSNVEYITKTHLDKVQRQKGGSEVLDFIETILEQNVPFKSEFMGRHSFGEKNNAILDIFTETGEYVLDWVSKEFLRQMEKYNDIMQVQCLGATRIRGALSVFNINRAIKEVYNPYDGFKPSFKVTIDGFSYFIQEGDKVVCTKNNYGAINVDGDAVDVYNGSIGVVKEIEKNYVTIDFDDELVIFDTKTECNIELGYCLTNNKMQGSEAKCIIGAIDNSCYALGTNEFIYTLVSRAKDRVVLYAQNYIYRQSIKTREQKNKKCLLVKFLKKEL